MRKLLQQIKRELKTLRCLRGRTQPRLAGRSESARTETLAICWAAWLSPAILPWRFMRHCR